LTAIEPAFSPTLAGFDETEPERARISANPGAGRAVGIRAEQHADGVTL
jgi:hypothetical protein